MSHRAVIFAIWIIVGGCMPFPRYAYIDETRVEAAEGRGGFSEEEIQRAQAVSDRVAKETRMVSGAEKEVGYLDADRMLSESRTPPRRFLMSYTGTLRFGLPLRLRLELSDDGKTLYFSLSDPNQGTASATFERIDALLKKRVEAAFPDFAITHEPKVIGPIWSLPP